MGKSDQPKKGPGRPRGTKYDISRTIQLRTQDGVTLDTLADRWECSEAEVIRRLLDRQRMTLDLPQGAVTPAELREACGEAIEHARALEKRIGAWAAAGEELRDVAADHRRDLQRLEECLKKLE